ncbi:endolytic transglycosylase MltG [Reinekea thalattae]|uniref:Endolytic murein transglycosylase n=1 Tax=Reinekea thalattae TaxID=2593301 RepID=A0A5C8Z888_9GAMM|nr:endolytic transglycosylase MltG [Reinekea thalattae]TXR53513.1 endolytic transglycosylase MltG [Reinekea thalattae]
MIKKIIVSAIVLFLTVALISASLVLRELNKPINFSTETQHYTVAKGSSLKRVLNDFSNQGWVAYPRVHELWLRFQGKTNIQSGEYELSSQMTVDEIIEQFVRGEKILRSVRFIEGKTVTDYLVVIRANSYLTQTLDGLSLEQIALQVDPELENLEGWLFPDTYLFESGTRDIDILRLAYSRMQTQLDQLWAERSEKTAVSTPYEALILASIVEKETGAAFERPEIAGVFTRRLERRMRLQTDPTVIYGLGADFDGNITRRHLRTDTPYNTYTRGGLPPTPIANPGREAIWAALNPADGESIFFVAKGDGTHYFSSTLKEHNAAVRQYQRFGRREDYQSAPAQEATAE